MAEPTRVLAFGAHPDDVEFHCAGTLVLLQQAGWEVAIATMTAGGGGSRQHDWAAARRIRLAECKASADVLGASYYYAGGADMDVDFRHELRVKTVRVFRQVRPDVVITLPPADYHTDHEETSRLVRAACFFAPIPNYPEQDLPPIGRVPHLYYTYARKDILGRPAPVQFVVDIGSVQETKTQMLACHESQRDWVRSHHGHDDYLRSMKERDAVAGNPAGLTAAEGFCQHLGAGYPHENVLAAALGDYVHEV